MLQSRWANKYLSASSLEHSRFVCILEILECIDVPNDSLGPHCPKRGTGRISSAIVREGLCINQTADLPAAREGIS